MKRFGGRSQRHEKPQSMSGPDPYWYISDRLVRQIVDRANAQKSKGLAGLTLNVPGLGGAGISLKDLEDPSNQVAAARAAEVLLYDYTGTLDDEELPRYLGYRGPLRMWIFEYKAEANRVLWLAVEQDRTLLVACGSASNYRSHPAALAPENWYPSSAEGMEEILQERGRLDVSTAEAVEVGNCDVDKLAVAAASHTLGLQANSERSASEFDLLCEVHGEARDVVAQDTFQGGPVFPVKWDRVLFGAPLWVREPDLSRAPPGVKI